MRPPEEVVGRQLSQYYNAIENRYNKTGACNALVNLLNQIMDKITNVLIENA